MDKQPLERRRKQVLLSYNTDRGLVFGLVTATKGADGKYRVSHAAANHLLKHAPTCKG